MFLQGSRNIAVNPDSRSKPHIGPSFNLVRKASHPLHWDFLLDVYIVSLVRSSNVCCSRSLPSVFAVNITSQFKLISCIRGTPVAKIRTFQISQNFLKMRIWSSKEEISSRKDYANTPKRILFTLL